MKRIRKCAKWLAVVGAGSMALHADDWPQWLGPDRSGISRETLAGPIVP
jgi:hypothetical protein